MYDLEVELLKFAKKYQILYNFKFNHLPPALKDLSMMYASLAVGVVKIYDKANTGNISELIVCLRKILEAKDAGVRSIAININELKGE